MASYSAISRRRFADPIVANDPLRVDWLPAELTAPGRLGVTIAPGRLGLSADRQVLHARNVDADYRALAAQSVDLVVCLQETHEGAYVAEGARSSCAVKVERIALPIVDSGTPWIRRPLARLIGTISAQLDGGRSVVIHCAGGLGRSGVVVGCWLRAQGVGTECAFALLHERRGPRCPENDAQRAYSRSWLN